MLSRIDQQRETPLAWWPWAILLSGIVVFILGGSVRSVTPLYFEAAGHWLAGDDIYIRGGRGFLYLPQAAILAIPFTFLPKVPGELLWRMMTIGVFALGTHRLYLLFRRVRNHEQFVVMSCVTAPLAWSGALNGQATLVMAGLLMLAAHDLVHQRLWRAASLLALALAVKPLAIVMVLLIAALWPVMRLRLLASCAVMVAIPYLVQSPTYVSEQYEGFLAMLVDAARLGVRVSWAQLFGMLRVLDVEVSESVQAAVRVAAAGLTLTAGWQACRRLEPGRAMAYAYSLAACYLMLFNPRTENNTYAMLGPAIGWLCGEALVVERRFLRGGFYILLALGIVGSHEIGRLVSDRPAIWLAPLMALGFTVDLTASLLRESSLRRRLEAAGGYVTLTSLSAREDHWQFETSPWPEQPAPSRDSQGVSPVPAIAPPN